MATSERDSIIDSVPPPVAPSTTDVNDDSFVPPPLDMSGLDAMSEAMGIDGEPPAIPTTETPTEAPAESSDTEQPAAPAAASDASGPDAMTRLRSEAQSLGFRPDDLSSLDAANLAALVETHRRLAIQGAPGPVPQGQFAPPQFPQQFPPQVPGQYAPQPGQPQQPVQFTPFAPPNPDVFTDEAVQYFQGLNEHYARQTAALAQQNQVLLQHQAMREQMAAQEAAFNRRAAASRELDQWVASQGAAFEPLFGKGDIAPESPYARVRDQVYRAAETMAQRSVAAGVQPDMNWIREQAARQVLGQQYDFFQQQAAKNPSGQRPQQPSMRANGRGQASAPSSAARKQRAGEFAENFFRQLESAN